MFLHYQTVFFKTHVLHYRLLNLKNGFKSYKHSHFPPLSFQPIMPIFFFLLFFLSIFPFSSSSPEHDLLLQIKASLDPENRFLSSWTPYSDPCSTVSFEGVACNEQGHVANISLQGKGLTGKIPAALGELESLTGLYLHFNALSGEIPNEIATLSQLSDLYLNVNNLSGEIPSQIGNMANLQGIQLI